MRADETGPKAVRAAASLLAALLLFECSGGGGTPLEKPDPPAGNRSAALPSCLFVTIDTWRWDHVGLSGMNRVRTPNLDRLAEGGLYEPEVVTPCPLTTPAHATLFTGLHPMSHRVFDCTGYALSAGIPTLAEAFSGRGYRTAAFVSSQTLLKKYGLDRGFEVYDDSGIERRSKSDWLAGTKDGLETTDAALAYLSRTPGTDPVFVWVHYFDPHHPYRPRPRYEALYPGRPYAQQIAFVDDQVARLIEALKGDGRREWRLAIVGDHGEGLGERNEVGHGYGLYRSTLHVPMILHPRPEPPLVRPKPWSLLDVDPTVREWFGLPKADRADGESLFREADPERTLACLTLLPTFAFSVNPNLGVRRGNYMYMRHGREELYDLGRDPDMRTDLAGEGRSAAALEELRSECRKNFPLGRMQEILRPTLSQTPSEMEALRGLGYLAGGVPDLHRLQKADILVVLREFRKLEEARVRCYNRGEWPPLRERYGSFLKAFPRAWGIYSAFGKDLLDHGDPAAAVRNLEAALKGRPDYGDMLNLGTACLELGRLEEGRRLLEAALLLNDRDPVLHRNLGILYYQYLPDPQRALRHFRALLSLEPGARDRERYLAVIAELEARGGGIEGAEG